MIVVVSGPGGVGKGTVVDHLVANNDDLALSRSWTTRDIRPGEAPDSYVFVGEAEFQEQIVTGGFLEWNHFLGAAYYGTPLPDPDGDTDLVLEIDVHGAKQVLDKGLDPLLIFIDAPSGEAQRMRLVGRGDTAEQVDRRMRAGETERELAAELPYVYVINDDVNDAAVEIARLVARHKGVASDSNLARQDSPESAAQC